VTSPLTVSAIQYRALHGGIAANVPEHVGHIEDADSHGARLVIFPELSLTGYSLGLLEDPGQWITEDDGRLNTIREICRRTGITAVVGAPYRQSDGTRRLASLGIHPNGAIDLGFKSRMHGPELELFSPGDGVKMLDVDGWKVALAICYDAAHPNHADMASQAGADVYAVSAVYTEAESHRLALHLGARAMDNRMFAVVANLGGITDLGTSCGRSGFWGPDGLVMKQAAGIGTEVLTTTLRHGAIERYRARPLPGQINHRSL
jgi:predicted amidohydrolase